MEEKQNQSSNNSKKQKPPRFWPIYFDMGMTQVFLGYFMFAKNIIPLPQDGSKPTFKQKFRSYIDSFKSKSTLMQYRQPSVLGFLYRGSSFAIFDYFFNSKPEKKIYEPFYYLYGGISGMFGLFNFKFMEYIFRVHNRIKLQGYAYLEILHPEMIKSNLVNILTEKDFISMTIKQIPISLANSSLYFGLYYSATSRFPELSNLQKFMAGFATSIAAEMISSPVRGLLRYRRFMKGSNIFQKIIYSAKSGFNPLTALQHASLLAIFDGFVGKKKTQE